MHIKVNSIKLQYQLKLKPVIIIVKLKQLAKRLGLICYIYIYMFN